MNGNPHRKRLASAMAFAIFSILAIGSMDTDVDSPAYQEVQSLPPKYTLSAKQLAKEYHRHEVAADLKYQGEIVLVSGRIQSIGKGVFGNVYVTIGGGFFFIGSVPCYLGTGSERLAASLSKGQRITVKGRVAGSGRLEPCHIQQE